MPHPRVAASSASWLQVGNFLVTGTLVIAGAVGLARVVTTGRGRRWAPLMLGLYGLGLIGAGFFKADPGMGFPPGAPEQTGITGPGALHFVAGGFGFAGFIAACFIVAARFSSLGRRGWAGFSVLTGALFLAGFAGVASGSRAAVPYFAAGRHPRLRRGSRWRCGGSGSLGPERDDRLDPGTRGSRDQYPASVTAARPSADAPNTATSVALTS